MYFHQDKEMIYQHIISLRDGFMMYVLYFTLINAHLQQNTEPAWWRHQMETFSALLAVCEGNPSVTGEFPSQRPMTRSFDILFHLRQNKRLNKQSRRRLFETPSPSLWRYCNGFNDTAPYHGHWKPVIELGIKSDVVVIDILWCFI